jgi:hypothetical protein
LINNIIFVRISVYILEDIYSSGETMRGYAIFGIIGTMLICLMPNSALVDGAGGTQIVLHTTLKDVVNNPIQGYTVAIDIPQQAPPNHWTVETGTDGTVSKILTNVAEYFQIIITPAPDPSGYYNFVSRTIPITGNDLITGHIYAGIYARIQGFDKNNLIPYSSLGQLSSYNIHFSTDSNPPKGGDQLVLQTDYPYNAQGKFDIGADFIGRVNNPASTGNNMAMPHKNAAGTAYVFYKMGLTAFIYVYQARHDVSVKNVFNPTDVAYDQISEESGTNAWMNNQQPIFACKEDISFQTYVYWQLSHDSLQRGKLDYIPAANEYIYKHTFDDGKVYAAYRLLVHVRMDWSITHYNLNGDVGGSHDPRVAGNDNSLGQTFDKGTWSKDNYPTGGLGAAKIDGVINHWVWVKAKLTPEIE